MKNSSIEWTHHTFNPWIGCTQISPACDHCYAMTLMSHRYHRVEWGAGKRRVRTSPQYWRQPLRWNRDATARGVRERVFCASLADVFDGEMPKTLSPWREDLWKLIERTPQLDWLLLTKRPGNIKRLAPWKDVWPHNVWVGTSVENEEWARRRLPILSEVPAVVRFVSAEPLLDGFDLADYKVDWLIAGGESGQGFRSLDADHVRHLRDQCTARGIPFFFKQWGGRTPKAGGRELDGSLWSELPTPSPRQHDALLRGRDERIIAAYHETGHVVMQCHHGGVTLGVEIFDDGTGFTHFGDNFSDLFGDLDARIEAAVAGAVAEAMLLGENPIPSSADIEWALDECDAESECLTDLDDAARLLRARPAKLQPTDPVGTIDSAHRRCREVLAARWELVDRLAKAVLGSPEGILSWHEIEAICAAPPA